MKAVRFLLLISAAAFYAMGCGGGEGEKKAPETPAQQPAATVPAATPAGYTVVAVTDGGSIAGTVTYAGKAQARVKLPVTKDVEVCGKAEHFDESLVVGSNGGVKDVVVSITNISSGKGMEAMGSSFVLDQKGCKYSPHLSVVPVNTPLKILNPDGILHNIHTYSEKNPSFNKSQPQFKREMEASFEHPESITVKCDVHGWMSANIKVVNHPYHATTAADGKYTLADVPPGTYTVEFWHEKLGIHSMQVTVAAGAATTLDHAYPAQAGASD